MNQSDIKIMQLGIQTGIGLGAAIMRRAGNVNMPAGRASGIVELDLCKDAAPARARIPAAFSSDSSQSFANKSATAIVRS